MQFIILLQSIVHPTLEIAIQLVYVNIVQYMYVIKFSSNYMFISLFNSVDIVLQCSDAKKLVCIASGREMSDYQFWMCGTCKRCAYEKEIVQYKNCPLCHTPINQNALSNTPSACERLLADKRRARRQSKALGDRSLNRIIDQCKSMHTGQYWNM